MKLDEAFRKALPRLATSASEADRIAYARDLWPRHHLAVSRGSVAEHRPGLVVWPSSTDELAELVRFCADESIPLVPFGAGSGVCGGVLPNERLVVVDLKRLERVRTLDRDACSIEVEAGAMGIRLEEELGAEGFTVGHFPSSILCSTVGGWLAARGAGQCSGLYGKIEDMVASIECVVGRGEIVRLRRRIHGPDLTPLLIGSEGVLGVITAATLRLHRAPASRAFAAFSFPSIEAGWSAMREMFQSGLRPAVSRLYDPFDSFIARMGSVRRGKKRSRRHDASGPHMPGAGAKALRAVLRAPRVLNELIDGLGHSVMRGSTLILVFEGTSERNADELARATGIALRMGARALGEGPARHWLEHRYSVSYRQSPVFMSGAFSDTMEVAAPWSRLGALYDGVRRALSAHVFVMAHLSHAYPDGCSIYFTFAGSAPTPAEAEARYDAAWRAALSAAIEAGGTLSHHHGVGRSKAPRLGSELGLGVDLIHALRGVFDPAGIMNPGNLVPREAPTRKRAATPPSSPRVDRESQLVHASGVSTLAEVERALGSAGLSLGLDNDAPPLESTTVGAWLAQGARGAPDPWLDPVAHLCAGFSARLDSGADLELRPAPRRAVGPDLFALFLGMQGRVGAITSAQLAAQGATRARALPTKIERDPAMDEGERAYIERVIEATRSVR